MTVKEMQNRVGGLSSYIPLIILVFCWYFMDNLYNAAMPLVPGSGLETLLYWMYRLLAVPLMTAGVYGGIHNMLRRQEISSINAFFDGAKDNYWRVAGANLLSTVFIMIITVIILLAGGAQQPDLEDNKLLQAMVTIPYAAISLFWFTESLWNGRYSEACSAASASFSPTACPGDRNSMGNVQFCRHPGC
jgi:hypothetical protein